MDTATITNPAQCSRDHTFTASAPMFTIIPTSNAFNIYNSFVSSMFTADARSHGWEFNQDLSTCYSPLVPAPGQQLSASYLTHTTAEPVISTVSEEPDISQSTAPEPSPTPDQPTPASTSASVIPSKVSVSLPTADSSPASSSSSSLEQPTPIILNSSLAPSLSAQPAPINSALLSTPDQSSSPSPPDSTPPPQNPSNPASPLIPNPLSQPSQPSNPAQPISSIVIGDSTVIISAASSAIIIGGSITISQNQIATVGDTPISVPPSGAVVMIGSSTVNLGSIIICQFGQSDTCATADTSISNIGTYPTIVKGIASSNKAVGFEFWGFFGVIIMLICLL